MNQEQMLISEAPSRLIIPPNNCNIIINLRLGQSCTQREGQVWHMSNKAKENYGNITTSFYAYSLLSENVPISITLNNLGKYVFLYVINGV